MAKWTLLLWGVTDNIKLSELTIYCFHFYNWIYRVDSVVQVNIFIEIRIKIMTHYIMTYRVASQQIMVFFGFLVSRAFQQYIILYLRRNIIWWLHQFVTIGLYFCTSDTMIVMHSELLLMRKRKKMAKWQQNEKLNFCLPFLAQADTINIAHEFIKNKKVIWSRLLVFYISVSIMTF